MSRAPKTMLGAMLALAIIWVSTPLCAADLLTENFESYTTSVAIPTVAAGTSVSGVKSSGQVTASTGVGAIGAGGNVAWLNDVGTSSGQLEFNAGAAPQTTLAVAFEIFNNATPATSMPINIGLLAWNSAVATAGGSSAKRIAGVTFTQSGNATAQTFSVQGNGTVASGLIYDRTVKQSVKIYANDQDTSPISYIGPDSVYRTLNANSFTVFLNGAFVITSTFNPIATDNAGLLLTGNSNLGRVGFNTSTANTGSWLIDNVIISDMTAGVLLPAPVINSSLVANGQAGESFTYQITASNSPASFNATGLPSGLSINTTTGLITGTPTASGTSSITLSASHAGGTGSATLILNITGPAPVITSVLSASGRESSTFSYQITATGSPASYAATGLPAGLTVNTTTGVITGTPDPGTAGTWNVTLSATAGGSTGSAALILTVVNRFYALRSDWMNTLIADVTATKSTSSINARSSGYQTSMLYTVSSIKVTNGGSGYTSAPTVNIVGVAGGGATATAAITAGKVSSVTVTAGGSGYITNPTVTFSGGGGSGAFATPQVSIWSDLPVAVQTGVGADIASGNMADSFKRLEYMAQAYAIPGCALYQNGSLLAAIVGGLDWLTSNVYASTGTIFGNWYDWEIAAPQALNNAAVLLLSNPSALNTTRIADYIKAAYNFGPNSVNQKDYFFWGALTGANTSNAALTMAVQGILLGNNTVTVTRFWQNTAGHPVNPQADYVISGSLLLDEARGNLSGDNPFDYDGRSVFTDVASGDGFYADGSFIFHYNIPYTGQYGQELVENIAILVKLLHGSSWEITAPELSNVYDWIIHGFEPLMYNGAMMDMVRGRAIASSSSDEYSVGAKVIANIRSVASFAPPDIAAELTAFADSPQLPPGQYHFPSMDRVVAFREGHGFGISMSSTRVGGYEINTTSPTNLKGWYTGAGVTYLYLGDTDTQYTDSYWATVDWYHLPGTTAEMNATPDDAVTDQNWAGGAQVDKTYGVAGLSAHPAGTNLYAKKSWFMLDDEIVCLGAGITSTSAGNQVDTTVENRKLATASATAFNIADTQYTLTSPATWASPVTVTTASGATWCALAGVGGYYFPNGASNLQAQFVSGSGAWTTINSTDSDSAVYTDYYLKLWFNHGVAPTNEKYAYVILPNRGADSVKAYAANPDVTILSNTQPTAIATGIQAVKSRVPGVVAANFWAKTGGPDTGGTADFITVSKQCSVIVKETHNRLSVGIADPTQSNTGNITVTLDDRASLGTLSADPGITVTGTNPITLSVNVNGSKGKSFNAAFDVAPRPLINSNPNMVAAVGVGLNYQITVSNAPGPTSYGATGLPPGLSLNPGTGLITGSPTTAGTYSTTLSASNENGTGHAILVSTVAAVPTNVSFAITSAGLNTWTCPANVATIQIDCWGGGGAGGSVQRSGGSGTVHYGGGGAGGAYARLDSYSVNPGNLYYANVGSGGANNSTVNDTTVAGGDTWFNSVSAPSSMILAKGGAGGQSAIGNTIASAYGTGGMGTTVGSLGDLVCAGGNGANGISGFAGGGGSGAGAGIAGVNASNNVGGLAPAGGGSGGTGPTAGSVSGGAGSAPGGGGAGSRDSSGITIASGGGGAGQVIITVKTLTVTSTLTPVENWRHAYFAVTANTGEAADAADPDDDGLTNHEEYIFGTSPLVSEPGGLLRLSLQGGDIDFSFLARAATGAGYDGLTRHYAVESNTDLSNAAGWSEVLGFSDIMGGGQNVAGTQTPAGSRRFFRLRIWLQ